MNGAESLIRTLAMAGVEVCFANPGTTEMPLVAALDAEPRMRAVLGLFEGVCTGAADGYGRMTGQPAATLLHLGPGFANGIANLHNARRAHAPVVNLIGDQATWHLAADAPLTSDIVSLASPVSGFVRATNQASELARDGADALAAARGAPNCVATLIAPADCQWEEAGGPVPVPPSAAPQAVGADTVGATVEALRSGAPAMLLLGHDALREPGLHAAAAIAHATGAMCFSENFPARVERGGGLPAIPKLPYFPEQALEVLSKLGHLVLVGAGEPVAFFGYPDTPSRLASEGTRIHTLATPGDDAVAALEAVAEALGAPAAPRAARERPEAPEGALDPGSLGRAVAALQPDGAIVMDEAATSGVGYALVADAAPRHTVLGLTGGAIGQGLPCATGAAIACPDRRVISLQADGSGMYTLQALWTQARESLDVTTIVCANRAYRILQVELARAGIAEPGPKARALTDLGHPDLDWVALAKGLGVPAVRVDRSEDLCRELAASFSEPGPRLIEAVL